MEEKVYNEDEIKLLELIEYVNGKFRNGEFTMDATKEEIEHFILQNEDMKIDIGKFANNRFEELHKAEEEEKDRFLGYYNETCTHCKKVVDVQPSGEMKGEKAYTFYYFKCPKCRKNFRSHMPVDDHDAIAHYELYLAALIEKSRHPDPRGKEFKLSQDELREMIKKFNDFKDSIHAKDKRKEEIEIELDNYSQNVKGNIAVLSNLKNLMEDGIEV